MVWFRGVLRRNIQSKLNLSSSMSVCANASQKFRSCESYDDGFNYWVVDAACRSEASRMAGEKEIWQKIGEGFVQAYYNQFDNTNRMELGNLYSADACLTWEGAPFQGREAIAAKLAGLPFKRIKHIITEQDFQPTIDSCILIMVFGQLQVDDDPPMAFHQVFMLKSQSCSWACTNDVFRLGIHNIPV